MLKHDYDYQKNRSEFNPFQKIKNSEAQKSIELHLENYNQKKLIDHREIIDLIKLK